MLDPLDEISRQLRLLIKDEQAKVETAALTGDVVLVGTADGLLRFAGVLIDAARKAQEQDTLPYDVRSATAVLWDDCLECFVIDNPSIPIPEYIGGIGVVESQEAVSRLIMAMKRQDGQIEDEEV